LQRLSRLHRQGVICFDSERGQWSWDLDAVRAASATANVVELMVRRLATLSGGTRAVLKIAACLGNTFSVAAIAQLLGTDGASVVQALAQPAREGLIVPLTSNVRFLELAGELAAQQSWDARFGFQHDRVQERPIHSPAPRSARSSTCASLVERSGLAVQLRLSDDGRGLALDLLRARSGQRSLSDAELAEAVFTFGVSSASELSSTSGRGVGLDALRSELRQRGADAFIEFTEGTRDGYRTFQLVLRLPGAAFLPRGTLEAPARNAGARRTEPPLA
jgi:hypothetical protein